MSDIKKIYGIDTLYYFCESNDKYKELYQFIEEDIERQNAEYETAGIRINDRIIAIYINGNCFIYINKSKGFTWLKDESSLFRIGLKSPNKNDNVHDIFVQLDAIGIYTQGIKKLVSKINYEIFKDYVTDKFPINRVDVNCFVQHDFTFIKKNMFVTRKRFFKTISDIGNANIDDTISIGKPPYKFRIYNKRKELSESHKKILMNEYFKNHEFDLEEHIFNVEFQFHREVLKTFIIGKDSNGKPLTINSVEDVFLNIEQIFKIGMSDIRLIDLNTMSKKAIENNNKRRAKNLPIWDDIKDNISFKEFYQSQIPIEKLKPKEFTYSDIKFENDFIAIIRKGNENGINVGFQKLQKLIHEAIYGKEKVEVEFKQRFIPVEIQDEKGKVTQKLRLLENGTLFEPVVAPPKPTKDLSNYELKSLIQSLKSKDSLDSIEEGKLYVAIKIAKARDLVFDTFLKSIYRNEDELALTPPLNSKKD